MVEKTLQQLLAKRKLALNAEYRLTLVRMEYTGAAESHFDSDIYRYYY